MGRHIILECDLCSEQIDDIPRSQRDVLALKTLIGNSRIEHICENCLAQSKNILQSLFSQQEELNFKSLMKLTFGLQNTQSPPRTASVHYLKNLKLRKSGS